MSVKPDIDSERWLEESRRPDGSLYSPDGYVEWKRGCDWVGLDGEFTLDDLKALVAYIERERSMSMKRSQHTWYRSGVLRKREQMIDQVWACLWNRHYAKALKLIDRLKKLPRKDAA